jgi:prepilin-type N-terminal cleavage/methylation domain-containing protein
MKKTPPPTNRARTTRRRAVTLIEMLIVISLLSVAFAAMAFLLNSVWRIQHSMNAHSLTLNTLLRLADQFRSDVHSAASASIRIGDQSASVNPPSHSDSSVSSEVETPANSSTAAQPDTADHSARQSFTLTLPDQNQIDYQVTAGSINRILHNGEKLLAHEDYVLPSDAVVKWEITSSDFNHQQTGWQASLLISYPRTNDPSQHPERRQLRIDAAAGLQSNDIRITENKP